MKFFTRGTSLKVLGRLVGSALVVACIAGCGSVGSEQENIQPTDPTPGSGTSIRGTMQITPSTITLTVANGGTGSGAEFFFQLTGGKPPYVWNNSWPQMAQLTPIDELGRGYATRAQYEVRNFGGSGDDFITVRDSVGDIATAVFTKIIEDPEAPPATTAPTVVPATATLTCGLSIDLTASGGNGIFRWTTSSPATQLVDPTTGIPDDSGQTMRLETSPCAVTSTVTVTVTSGGLIGTSSITLNP